MAKVMVVDDSPVDRRVVSEILKRNFDLEIESAVDGADALEKMAQDLPDLVITDLRMPNVDGLELVRTIRDDHPGVPVVLITSAGSEEIAAEALKTGAASYVPKRRMGVELKDIVRHLLSIVAGKRTHKRLMGHMSRIEYGVVLDNDWSMVGPLVKYIEDSVTQMGLCDDTDLMRVSVALTEALLNSIYHGNLGVSSDLRTGDGSGFESLAKERRQTAPYQDRRVYIDTKLSRDEASFSIRDEGHGFDVSRLPDPTDSANIAREGGRGILLMRMFMDDVVFNEAGNHVTMTKRRESATSQKVAG